MGVFKKLFALVLIFSSLVCSSNTTESSHSDAEIEVLIRMIGHKVLLDMAEDSTSRVLPIQKLGKEEYLLTFNTQFKLNPSVLVETVRKVMRESSMVNSFIVEVFEPSNSEASYSFKIDPQGLNDMIACRTRDYPLNSYSIKVKLLEFHEQGTKVVSKAESSKVYWWWIIPGVLCLLIAFFLRNFLFGPKTTSQENLNVEQAVQIGNYQVNFIQDELHFGPDRIELTSKESNLLKLLYQHTNATVERDEILRQVWGDEGDYVGRTLDVFISKLRKKLDRDEAVKIVNARGVGYKLVVG